jgi:hypothetical protein
MTGRLIVIAEWKAAHRPCLTRWWCGFWWSGQCLNCAKFSAGQSIHNEKG